MRTCPATSALATSYQCGQRHPRCATDYKLGVVTLTPSVAVFGGESRNNQIYSLRDNNGSSPNSNEFYSANTRLKWDDVGVRAGLDRRTPLTVWLSGGVGVWGGVAS